MNQKIEVGDILISTKKYNGNEALWKKSKFLYVTDIFDDIHGPCLGNWKQSEPNVYVKFVNEKQQEREENIDFINNLIEGKALLVIKDDCEKIKTILANI